MADLSSLNLVKGKKRFKILSIDGGGTDCLNHGESVKQIKTELAIKIKIKVTNKK